MGGAAGAVHTLQVGSACRGRCYEPAYMWSSGAIVSALVLYSKGYGLNPHLDLHATKMVAADTIYKHREFNSQNR